MFFLISKGAAIKRPVAGSLVVEAALWQPDGAAEEGCSITGGGWEASLGTVPPISLSHHMPSSCSATGGALCRHLCTLFKCPACVCVWHQRMWQGLHCRLATAAMWCRYRYSPACLPASAASCRVRHPRVARHGTCGAGAAPSPVGFTRVDSHLPPCKVLLTAGRADSEKTGQGGFGLWLLCSRK